MVDGIITDEFKTHQILFGRTSSIDSNQFVPVEGARVLLIQGELAPTTLTEVSPGVYITPLLSGTAGATYKLEIMTEEGELIESSPVTMKANPVITSAESRFINESERRGIEVNVTTEETPDQALFLRWSLEETYQFISVLPYRFDWIGGTNVVEVDVNDSDTCYVSSKSQNVLLFSGVGLEKQLAQNVPIRFIREFSDELQNQYSVNITQYSLDEEGFRYWSLLEELNDSQGSTFDTQPGRIIGNLTSDRGSIVLGYFDASEVKIRRHTFKTNDFSSDGLRRDQVRLLNCYSELDTVPIIPVNQIGSYMTNFGDNVNIVGTLGFGSAYIVASKACSDCRLFGTNVKPTFWP